VVWTAGVANNPFFAANADQFTLAKNGRVVVNEFLEAKPHLYVIGDNAVTPFGGLAQTAINDANFVAADLTRRFSSRPRVAYKPKAPISVIPVGGRWAAVQAKNWQLFGWGGWLLRRAADFVAYRDVERWPAAIRVWLADFRREDDCPVCAAER
jgi:NADH dehydrogenase FAD-containing subunit